MLVSFLTTESTENTEVGKKKGFGQGSSPPFLSDPALWPLRPLWWKQLAYSEYTTHNTPATVMALPTAERRVSVSPKKISPPSTVNTTVT